MECNSDGWHLPVENNNKNGCGEDRIDSLPLSKKCGPTQAPDRYKSK